MVQIDRERQIDKGTDRQRKRLRGTKILRVRDKDRQRKY